MKREHYHLQLHTGSHLDPSSGSSSGGSTSMAAVRKAKMREEETQKDVGMGELLAVLGYKVGHGRSARRSLKRLWVVFKKMGFSHLASETVHYNPSDLSSGLESITS